MTSILGRARAAHWTDNGFLVLPGFVSDDDVTALSDTVDRAWAQQPRQVVVDDLVTGRRTRIADADPDHHFKVNDLYLDDARVREIALSERLGAVLAQLLGDEPVLCNTLNFDKGSQQPDHLDTLYMTPRTDQALVATWIALEDTEAGAGPLRYYPGSNHIEPYRFSTRSMHVHRPEMEQWSDYMAGQVERQGLAEQRFLARKGDLFIWHALLLHGGSEICDPGLTRQSLVSHYYTQTDCEAMGEDLRPAPGGFWLRKPALEVPAEQPAAPAAAPGKDLRERMEPLRTALD